MENEQTAHVSKIRLIVGMMLSPGTVLKNKLNKLPLVFSMLVSGFAFGLFFLQTGLDLFRTGQQPLMFVVITSLVGLVFGLLAIPLIAVFVWGVSKPFGSEKDIRWTVSAFCLSYSGALIYCVLGIVTSLTLGWHTAVAFGVTGVLWAIGPMISTIREMLKGKIYLCVLLAAVTGAFVLFCWSWIGRY